MPYQIMTIEWFYKKEVSIEAIIQISINDFKSDVGNRNIGRRVKIIVTFSFFLLLGSNRFFPPSTNVQID